jgi:hypothetical protein
MFIISFSYTGYFTYFILSLKLQGLKEPRFKSNCTVINQVKVVSYLKLSWVKVKLFIG